MEYQIVTWDKYWFHMPYLDKGKYLAICFLVSWKRFVISLTSCFELLRVFDNLKHVGKICQTVGVRSCIYLTLAREFA